MAGWVPVGADGLRSVTRKRRVFIRNACARRSSTAKRVLHNFPGLWRVLKFRVFRLLFERAREDGIETLEWRVVAAECALNGFFYAMISRDEDRVDGAHGLDVFRAGGVSAFEPLLAGAWVIEQGK